MLPEGQEAFEHFSPNAFPWAVMICVAVILALTGFEYTIVRKDRKKTSTTPKIMRTALILMLAFHALFEGAALGLNATWLNTLVVFFAIALIKAAKALSWW